MGTFTDLRDGKMYRTVEINGQVWMAQNFDYEEEDSICYDNNNANGKKYGRLYTWEMAINVCPEGWHLPSREEWQKLVDFVNTNKNANNAANRCLKSKEGWNIRGTDDFRFTALPGGYRTDSEFCKIGEYGRWWSSSEYDCTENGFACAYYCSIRNNGENLYWNHEYKRFLFSIRCVQD